MASLIYLGILAAVISFVCGDTPFGYTNRLSPLNWANLDPAYQTCATGLYQSPINIDSNISFALVNPVINFPVLPNATVLNTGVLVQVLYSAVNGVNGTAYYNGTTYQIVQFHFHVPGEHKVNYLSFPAEMHMVLESTCKTPGVRADCSELEPKTRHGCYLGIGSR